MTGAFLTKGQTAERLGLTPGTFRRLLPQMIRSGFPELNPVVERYHAADVEAWISSQSRINATGATVGADTQRGVNFDAL